MTLFCCILLKIQFQNSTQDCDKVESISSSGSLLIFKNCHLVCLLDLLPDSGDTNEPVDEVSDDIVFCCWNISELINIQRIHCWTTASFPHQIPVFIWNIFLAGQGQVSCDSSTLESQTFLQTISDSDLYQLHCLHCLISL